MIPEFCTCIDVECPFHPSNHDKGCTLCVEKNLRRNEIPACFFNKLKAPDEKLPTYTMWLFAELVRQRAGEEPDAK